MRDFVTDTWQDLREKRLWPVAVVMLLAIVAIPTVLAKSATTSTPADGVPPPNVGVRSAVTLETASAASSGKGSSLDVFAPDDPFVPPRASVRPADAGSAQAVDVVAAGADEGVGTGGGSDGGDETVDVEIEVPRAPQRETRTTAYEYVADISFWQGDRRRRIEGLRKLDMLPDEAAPVLIFMGATSDGGDATFLVDATLKAAGEGTCRPTRDNCAFVDIGPGSEHVFTSEQGDAFRLRIEEIRRVEVKPGAASSSSRRRARRSTGGAPAARRFTLPSLVDLVEVSTTQTVAGADSRNIGGGR